MKEYLTAETAIAHRSFSLKPSDETIDIFIGKPEKIHDEEWFCPYRIVGAGKDMNFQIHGIDSVQALQLVWQIIDAKVSSLDWELLWDGEPFKGFTQSLPK